MMTEFKQALQEILSDKHIPTFEVNNSENEGVAMLEWETLTDEGVILPDTLLYSSNYLVDWEEALKAIRELGIKYPIVDDFSQY